MENNLTIAHKADGPIVADQEKKLYDILSKLPSPKKEFNLTKSQRKWWYWFGREFISTRQLSLLDLTHLQKAAFWMDARCQAYAEISELGYKGLVQRFPSGATNITGHVSVIEKADKNLDDVSSHFGLSIRDRQKLKNQKEDTNQLSLFETVMQKLAQ
jgi:hypothetical protein